MKIRIVRSSGNVFEDLGFDPEEAEHLRARSELMIALTKVIEDRGLTQSAAAELFGVTQPRISNLMRGRIDLFSVDTLISMLARVGIRVKLVLSKGRKYSVA
jgi:predicted XRE-type DNA-binding protein